MLKGETEIKVMVPRSSCRRGHTGELSPSAHPAQRAAAAGGRNRDAPDLLTQLQSSVKPEGHTA